MNDAGGMEVLDATEELVEEVGHALVIEVHLDDLAQVGVHQLHHQVDVGKLLKRPLRCKGIQQANHLQAHTLLYTINPRSPCTN